MPSSNTWNGKQAETEIEDNQEKEHEASFSNNGEDIKITIDPHAKKMEKIQSYLEALIR